MSHMAKITAPEEDDITVFMGRLSPAEYEARRRIRTCRNAACYKLVQTTSQHARDMCHMITEVATYWIYRPAPVDTLDKAVAYMRGLLKACDAIEDLQVLA